MSELEKIIHGFASVLHAILGASAIDAATKAQLTGTVEDAKSSAAKAVSQLATSGATVAVDAAAAAPAAVGAEAAKVTEAVADKAGPVGEAMAPVVGLIAQAAASTALSTWLSNLEAHNGDHLAAAKATVESLGGVFPGEVAPAAAPANGDGQ